jgi:hypothetical protein
MYTVNECTAHCTVGTMAKLYYRICEDTLAIKYRAEGQGTAVFLSHNLAAQKKLKLEKFE